jgi:hypothetical protein
MALMTGTHARPSAAAMAPDPMTTTIPMENLSLNTTA